MNASCLVANERAKRLVAGDICSGEVVTWAADGRPTQCLEIESLELLQLKCLQAGTESSDPVAGPNVGRRLDRHGRGAGRRRDDRERRVEVVLCRAPTERGPTDR